MLTVGRLKRIKSYISRSNGDQSASTLNKFCCELVDEVKRLRIVLRDIADGVHCIPPDGKHDWDALEATREYATNALREPDLGPPDFVCVRPARCRICGREPAQPIDATNERIDRLVERLDGMDARIDRLAEKLASEVEYINRELSRHDRDIKDAKLDAYDAQRAADRAADEARSNGRY